MNENEIYDKYFTKEEYALENAPNELYSYRAGWNDSLKRAARLVRHDIRSKGKWILREDIHGTYCECSATLRLIGKVTKDKTVKNILSND